MRENAYEVFMNKFFIGWSGNKALADEVSLLIDGNTRSRGIVGGGLPKDMYIGAQVINQIQHCNFAILLVEDKNGQISPNLMFEWGYLMARLPVYNIYTFLINKNSRDLPSDLLGTWVFELSVDRENESDKEIACRIFEILLQNMQTQTETNYFDLVNNWRQVFNRITDKTPLPELEMCECLIAGCLAAYYYMDYKALRHSLESISGSEEIYPVIAFSKSYIDVFIESENMMQPLSDDVFFRLTQDFDMILARPRGFSEEIDLLVDMLCNNAYGLSCYLYLKNEGLDEETVEFCSQKALEHLEKFEELITKFEETHVNNKCLIQLLRAYVYNDLAHLHKRQFNNHEMFMQYLALSVSERKALHQTFVTYYNNPFLAVKLEQEHIIALSEQCVYMENSFTKTMSQNTIKKKVKEWEKELLFTSSLTERIKASIKMF